MSNTVAVIDDSLKQALDKLKGNLEQEFAELQKTTLKNQDVMKQKTEEIGNIVEELNQLGDIKTGIASFSKEMQLQNQRIAQLTASIEALAEANNTHEKKVEDKPKRHIGRKIFATLGISVLALSFISLIIANWDAIYRFISHAFYLH